MTKRLFMIAFSVLVLTAGTQIALAQDWKNLGTKEVKDKQEQDTWHVTAARGQFRRIKLTVAKSPVKIERLEITYTSGQKEEKEIRTLIRAGGSTRVIDLDDHTRYIQKVDIWYEAASLAPGRKSLVTLWGKRR
jgi:hypothetical protein